MQHHSDQLQHFLSGILRFFRHVADDNVGAYAASASFFIMLSIFPALILITSLLHLTPLTQADLLDAIAALLPTALMPLVQSVLAELFQFNSATLISVTAVLAIWSASRGVYGVMVGTNAIFHTKDRRNYLLQRMICIIYMMLLMVALLVTLALHVFGKTILGFLSVHLPRLQDALALISSLRFLFTLGVLTLVFTLIYLTFPCKRVHLRACVPSALLAALGWLIFSSIFSIYVSHSDRYTLFYGSLAAIALFMLWLYICMTILLYGGVLASLLDSNISRRGSSQ